MVAGARRGRAGRRQALQQPALGPGAGHRRLDGDRQLVRAATGRPAPPRARCWSPPPRSSGSVAPTTIAGEERRRVARRRQEGDLRRARRRPPDASRCPTEVKLKDPKDFVFIGKHVPRTDSKAKSDGTRACSPQDVKLPDMLTAVVAHPPRFGAQRQELRRRRARRRAGRALRRRGAERRRGRRHQLLGGEEGPRRAEGRVGRRAWRSSRRRPTSSPSTSASPPRRAALARSDGDAAKAIGGAAKTRRGGVRVPVPRARGDGADELRGQAVARPAARSGTASSSRPATRSPVAQVLGLKPEQVKLNMLYAGGSFGRRANPAGDYVRRGRGDRQGAGRRRASAASRSSSCGRARTT